MRLLVKSIITSGIGLLGEIVTNKELESRMDFLEKLVVDSQEATQKYLQGLQQAIKV